VLPLSIPDALRLSANEQLLTVGLRASRAQLAVVDTRTFEFEIVPIGPGGQATTIVGHRPRSNIGASSPMAVR